MDAKCPLSMARATLYVYDLAVFNFTYISAIFACSIYKKRSISYRLQTDLVLIMNHYLLQSSHTTVLFNQLNSYKALSYCKGTV